MQVDLTNVKYAGFWTRFFAVLLDVVVLSMVLVPLLLLAIGPELWTDPERADSAFVRVTEFGFSLVATVLFWKYRAATPGKMMMGIIIVDETTGGEVPTGRLVFRYLAYIVSMLPCGLGYLWVAFDKRKQGFHDKLAKTLVVHKPQVR